MSCSMGRNRYIKCSTCFKSIRSDHVKTHKHEVSAKKKYPMKSCIICKKKMIGGNLIRHVKTHNKLSKEMLSDVLQYQRKYESEKCDGVVIKELIQKHGINWEALPKTLVKSIMMKDSTTSVDGNLRTWQSKLEKNIVPSEREIIWVVGKSGNEGKTWFQQYLQNQYGSNRTFAAPIKKSSQGILHTLSKQVLPLIDVFMFNIPRSFSRMDVPYELLEEIKDGNAVSTKYDSKRLTFKTPNIVLVFSNEQPIITKISKDRWSIFNIVRGDLIKRDMSWTSY